MPRRCNGFLKITLLLFPLASTFGQANHQPAGQPSAAAQLNPAERDLLAALLRTAGESERQTFVSQSHTRLTSGLLSALLDEGEEQF